jgi:hypothetical protein
MRTIGAAACLADHVEVSGAAEDHPESGAD